MALGQASLSMLLPAPPPSNRNSLFESTWKRHGSRTGTFFCRCVARLLGVQGYCSVTLWSFKSQRSLSTWRPDFSCSQQVPLNCPLSLAIFFLNVSDAIVVYSLSPVEKVKFFCVVNLIFYLTFHVEWVQDWLSRVGS